MHTPSKIQYFSGHKDSAFINGYLNSLAESSDDFQVVYRLRRMGEQFIDGVLSIKTVRDFAKFLPASLKAEAFIRQMKCWTFYTVLWHIAQDNCLTAFEQKVKYEIEYPSFYKPVLQCRFLLVWYKVQRIWLTRWKHPLVFNEYWLPATITFIWSVIRMQRIVKD